jgi:hypothetical protein
MGDQTARPFYSVCTTFTILPASGVGDPWMNAFSLSPNGQFITITFDPCAALDIPASDSIYLIQVVRPLAEDSAGARYRYAYREQDAPDSLKLDSLLTTAGYLVDVPPTAHVPYYLGRYHGDPNSPVGSIGSTTTCTKAFLIDNPRRGDNSYQPAVRKIRLEFEVNALATSRQGQGQWLGGCTWIWERPLHGSDVITTGSKFRSYPTPTFLAALDQWGSLRDWTLPRPRIPDSGGISCSP